MNWFKIGKGVHQGCILSPCLFNFCAEYIMWNARLNESQAGIKIAGRNINNLRYANDTTLIAESEEEPKSLLMRIKEKSEKAGLKLNIQETKIRAPSPIISWQIDGEKAETVTDFIFLGSKITVDRDCSHEIKRCLLLERIAMTNPDSNKKAETLLCGQRSICQSNGFACSHVRMWRRQWQPTPVLLPGKSHGRRSLVGCSPRGHEQSDTTEWLHFHFSLSCIGEGNGDPL